jgi:uncharacterized protein (UPF0216 family)
MNQVLVRQPRLAGDTVLKQAEVISQDGTTYRIKYQGEQKVVEVEASRIVPASKVYGGQPRVNSRFSANRIPQHFPESRSALGNLLQK